MIVGIDFGARLSGTTALCFDEEHCLELVRVPRREDADAYLESFMARYAPEAVYIDAPLSLPGAYFGQGEDFFYRACDRALGAMSPLFLGGLTARAVRFKQRLAPTPVYEVYPRATAAVLEAQDIGAYRRGSPADYWSRLSAVLPWPVVVTPVSWHEVDAILAWWSGWRHTNGQAKSFGNPAEGVIWV